MVKNITAVVYDTTVQILKYIPLWHDVVNGVFNSLRISLQKQIKLIVYM